jgi:hypothetical protein
VTLLWNCVAAHAVAFFFLFWSYAVAQLHEEGDGSCRHLFLLFCFVFSPCSIAKKAVTLYWKRQ